MKWEVKITEVGKEVKELVEASKQFDLVAEGKRDDMRDFTVHFEGGMPAEPLKEGDEVRIGDASLYIVALGEGVNEHIKEHGACTMDLSSGFVPSGSCCIMLDGIYDDMDFIREGAVIRVG